ncbi:MAG: hypothetical protein RJA70_3075, partial [Pseudomonadota bacterium]
MSPRVDEPTAQALSLSEGGDLLQTLFLG